MTDSPSVHTFTHTGAVVAAVSEVMQRNSDFIVFATKSKSFEEIKNRKKDAGNEKPPDKCEIQHYFGFYLLSPFCAIAGRFISRVRFNTCTIRMQIHTNTHTRACLFLSFSFRFAHSARCTCMRMRSYRVCVASNSCGWCECSNGNERNENIV